MRCLIMVSAILLLMGADGQGGIATQEKADVNLADPSILSAFAQLNPLATHLTTFFQSRISDRYDLVVICATEHQPYRLSPDRIFLGSMEVFGVYLKQRAGDLRLDSLIVEKAEDGVELQVARWSSSEIVLWRFDSVGRDLTSLKLFFDTGAPRLLARIEYEPFRVTRIIRQGNVPHFVASDMKHTLILRPQDDGGTFIIEPEAEAKPILASLDFYEWTTPGDSFRYVQPERHPIRRFGPEGRFVLKEESRATQKYARITETTSDGVLSFELPQSTWDEFEKSRPKRVRDGYTPSRGSHCGSVGVPLAVSAVSGSVPV